MWETIGRGQKRQTCVLDGSKHDVLRVMDDSTLFTVPALRELREISRLGFTLCLPPEDNSPTYEVCILAMLSFYFTTAS